MKLTIKDIILIILKELSSLFTDAEWNFDPWKTGGFIVLGLCIFGAIQIFLQVYNLDTSKLGILSGLIIAGTTIMTFLFSQSQKNDDSIRQNRKE